MYPSEGTVSVKGTIAPLIELGAGFDPELTARENIYLNGAILGFNRAFMNAHFDDIVEFAELQEFLDVPLKNFSSGMTARLGFAIATMVRTDILIVDEVPAVGDVRFQEKCKHKIAELLAQGTTLLFVSHSAEQVKEVCKKAIWLDHGVIQAYGETNEVYAKYEERYNTYA
jgi:ABC-type polysaccharide/polyol phosphate transport system ATPase subunit